MFYRNYRDCGCKDNEESIYDNSCGLVNNMDDEYMSECACGYNEPYSVFPNDPMIAESYVPNQKLNKVYKSCIGLEKGTIFPELVNFYSPCEDMEIIAYLKSTNKIGEGCNQ